MVREIADVRTASRGDRWFCWVRLRSVEHDWKGEQELTIECGGYSSRVGSLVSTGKLLLHAIKAIR